MRGPLGMYRNQIEVVGTVSSYLANPHSPIPGMNHDYEMFYALWLRVSV